MEEKILELLQQLQSAIVNVAPDAWNLLVMKQRISGIAELVVVVAITVIALYLGNKFRKLYVETKDEWGSDSDVYFVGAFFTYLVGIIIPLVTLEPIILKLFTPEYMAIKEIVGWLK